MSEVIVLSEWREKQGKASASKSPSTLSTTSDELGQMSISEDEILAVLNVYAVVKRARMQPYTTKSDFARAAANEIALAASEGFISTKVDETTYSNHWMVTHDGLGFMDAVEESLEGLHDVPCS